MTTDELKAFCAALPGAQAVLYGPPSNILVDERVHYIMIAQGL